MRLREVLRRKIGVERVQRLIGIKEKSASFLVEVIGKKIDKGGKLS
jgi:hypothetical protein